MTPRPAPSPARRPTLMRGRRFRLLSVYHTTFHLLASYGLFALGKKLRGSDWAERRLPELNRRSARRVMATILSVQGLFIKVGQLVSMLSNFLPADFRAELEGLQDQIPGRPWEEIRGRLRAELGEGGESRFTYIEPEPIASASLAQVHAGELPDGRRVVVKVQHLEIESLARLDLATVRRVLKIVGWATGARGLDAVLAQVEQMIFEELDFTRETSHLETIASHFEAEPLIGFPRVVQELSTRRVLVTTRIEGVKVTDFPALAAKGIDRTALAERILRAYCQMIFVDGVYHADPHPGNLLVRDDGGVVFLDFGAVGKLSAGMKQGIPRLLEAVLKQDREGILAALKRMGFVQQREDDEIAERVIELFYSRFLADLEIESWDLSQIRFDPAMKLEMLADLRRLDLRLSDLTSTFVVPREWILLERTLLLLLGVCTELHPEMRPMAVVKPYLSSFVLGGDFDWMALARNAVKDLLAAGLSLPGDLKRVLKKAERGELGLEIRGLRESARLGYAVAHQLLYGAFALGTGILAYVARIRGDDTFAQPLAAACGLCLFCLAVSLWRARKLNRTLRQKSVARRVG